MCMYIYTYLYLLRERTPCTRASWFVGTHKQAVALIAVQVKVKWLRKCTII